MVENSSAGLVMVGGDVSVTVTREERHQPALALYRAGATVAVELGWCVVESGKYRGERAIEVRLDGRRVGELTYLMSRRYEPLVAQVDAVGGRPGCEAVIESGAKGLEITLRLPREGQPAIPVPPVTAEETTLVMAPVTGPPTRSAGVPTRFAGAPAQAASTRPKFLSSRPIWIAAAVFALIVFVGIIGSIGDEEPPASAPAADTTTTSPTTTPTTTTTTPPPTTTTTPPEPEPAPKPKVTTEKPAPPPPAPEPEPVSDCDPNYSGCVPVADDVDCAGGSGNGPAYVDGPVRVIGSDIYDLDRDGDGTACDS